MDLQLKGKVALVTGASRGIGRAIATSLAREGARVCLCARGREDLASAANTLAESGATVHTVAADVSRQGEAYDAVASTIRAFGGIDLLINNVGGSLGTGPFDRATPEQWRMGLDVNLMSAIWCSQRAVGWMRDHGGGTIIHMSSISGREYASTAPYTAAKAALIALTKEMAVDLARFKIRVNAVAPGSILFPGGSWERRQQAHPDEIARMLHEDLPWGRFGRPDEVADLVAFLCSARASWISGATVTVDGAQGRAY